MAWTSPYTIVGGTAVLASWANTNIRDNELYLYTQANHQGQFVYGSTAGAAVIADTHNWNPDGLTTCNILRVDPSSNWDLTGVQGQTHGMFFWMLNGSGGILRLKHGDARSLANNQLTLSTGADYDLHYLGIAAFLYLYGAWRVKV